MIPVQPPMQGQPLPQPQPPAPAQQPVTIDAVMALLRDGMTRRFRIDIETDSTITGDESQERNDRTQFIETTTKFVQAWGPIVQANPDLAPLAGGLLKFGLQAFRTARTLEELFDETVDKLEAKAAQPKPPPQPSPDEVVKAQTAREKGQAEIVKARTDAMASVQDAAAKERSAQIDMAGKVMDHQHRTAEHHMAMERAAVQALNPPTSQGPA
ncbi:hypothetical protein M2222_008290 [Bradyrhizobium elkanii]|uniref:hypothetical protein n=1 Tax=Bradyrhizobium elkanii TaxID=29448 RepID=UPI0021683027|nr:hypothetical protein [Bradyrhizobium elkanii]MCS3451933.1 hypothetical protein [Bradyrhizobium elkanii]MCS3565968.1 hypothetical protein [Bradyrhizobium elkanii]MCW2153302.1 hypothetical protein [Bradyrhizobium elkanii]MCW2377035.1 hypothetical protein [Bradyrhizobium elkanii]